MKRIFLFFLILLGSVWLGVQFYKQPGYILIYYQHWAIETTTWFLVLSLLLTFFLLHFIINLLRGFVNLPNQFGRWRQVRQQEKAIRSLKKGYIDSLKENWENSEKALSKINGYNDLSFLSYMIAAHAADQQHALQKRDHYLQLAKKETKQNNCVTDAVQVQFFLKHQNPDKALQLLLPLRRSHPKDSFLLKLQAETYKQLRDSHHLLRLLPALKKSGALEKQQYFKLEKEAYLHSLKDNFYSNFESLQTIWNGAPKHLRHDPEILASYAVHLNRWNRSEQANAIIRKELNRNFDYHLLEYYIKTHAKIPAKQLALGEKLLKKNEDDPASLRAMGILCLRNKLWGQAKDYLERSLKLQPMIEVYSALGYIHEKLGENDKALIYYRKGLKVLISAV
jgi:HemY protein